MNWEAAGALGEIMGAIAVVATLLFLSRQIRDMRRSDFSGVLDRIVLTEIEILKMEKDASDLIDRGDRGEDLTESERFAVSRILMAWNSYSFHGHLREVILKSPKRVRAKEFARILVSHPIYLSLWQKMISSSAADDPNTTQWKDTVEGFINVIENSA